jgi:hypothetical protein
VKGGPSGHAGRAVARIRGRVRWSNPSPAMLKRMDGTLQARAGRGAHTWEA